ncbi:hypothetical protein LWI28_011200 [Acer negundo]|uniref:Uncharacterized protein n=1 Tax=Acer negundo TaxID=4023 RepID=A0AAD5IM98_ACENE|nr:hypothetical protein LWI28_011200 [Acer negundo]
MEERVVKLEEDSKVLIDEVTRRLSRSSELYLRSVQLGFDCGHRVGFELMRGYTKKIFLEGEWDNVDPIKARASSSIMFPAVFLPVTPLVSSSPSSVSPTANVGLSLGSSRPTYTPLLTPAKSRTSLLAKFSTLPTVNFPLSEMAARASRFDESRRCRRRSPGPVAIARKLPVAAPLTESATVGRRIRCCSSSNPALLVVYSAGPLAESAALGH